VILINVNAFEIKIRFFYQRAVQLLGRLFSVSEHPLQACYSNKVACSWKSQAKYQDINIISKGRSKNENKRRDR